MGQKVNPKVFRIGPLYNWSSRWFESNRDYSKYVAQDLLLREKLMQKLKPAGIAQIDIERSINKLDITIFVSKPGIAIGRGGGGLDELKKYITNLLQKDGKDDKKLKFELKVEPVKNINLNAYLVATSIADNLARRMSYKSVVNKSMSRVMTGGAKGIRVLLSGRIAGAEISRRNRFQMGSVPLSTIRERIDFVSVPSLTKSGYIGVKVWICLGEEK